MKKNTYVQFENSFFEKIINRKRMEMFMLVSRKINISKINDLLDVVTTNDSKLSSSNFFCRMFDKISKHKSISDQKINNSRFIKCLRKSITSNFSKKEINNLKSDLVISSTTNPRLLSSFEIARPIPEPAPVTQAIGLSSSLNFQTPLLRI